MGTRHCVQCGAAFYQQLGRPSARCTDCQNRVERYGYRRRKLRAEAITQAYYKPCSRCGRVMLPEQELHLDHVDGGAADEYRPGLFSHATCNVKAANTRAARRARASETVVAGSAPVMVPANLAQLDYRGDEYASIRASRPQHRWLNGDPVPPIQHRDGCDCRDRAERDHWWPSQCC